MAETRIPGKQLQNKGTYAELLSNLLEREAGWCSDDNILYGKENGHLKPLSKIVVLQYGIARARLIEYMNRGMIPVISAPADSGIKYLYPAWIGNGDIVFGSIYKDYYYWACCKQNGTWESGNYSCERSIYQPYPESVPPVFGALKILQHEFGDLGVRIGEQSSDLGKLVPNAPENSSGMILCIGDDGTIKWGIGGGDISSDDGSIEVETTEENNRKVVTLRLPEKVASGTYTKVIVNDQGVVVHGEVLSAEDIPELNAEKITSGNLAPERIGAGTITGEKLAPGAVGQASIGEGAVGAAQMDLRDMSPVLGGNGILITPFSNFLEFSIAGIVGDFGEGSPEARYLIAGNTEKKTRLDIVPTADLGGVTITLDPECGENAWMVGAENIWMACQGIAQIENDGHAANSVTCHNSATDSALSTPLETSLYFYESGSIPDGYGATLQVMVHFTIDSVQYCAVYKCAFINIGGGDSTSTEKFFGVASLYELNTPPAEE